MEQYFNKAKKLLNSQIKGNIKGFVSKEGWIFKYNEIMNEIAIAKPNGEIATLFRPKKGIEYWKEQTKLYK